MNFHQVGGYSIEKYPIIIIKNTNFSNCYWNLDDTYSKAAVNFKLSFELFLKN